MAEDSNTEEWRPIEGHPGYEASSLGRIRSLDRILTDRRGVQTMKPGKILAQSLTGEVSWYYSLRLGRGETQNVHTLVCTAFHGPRPSFRHTTAHNDGVETNNAASNLRWATQSENLADKIRHGTSQHGERNTQAKLTDEKVRTIRKMIASGGSDTAIGNAMRVSRRTISFIRHRKRWGWLDQHLDGHHL